MSSALLSDSLEPILSQAAALLGAPSGTGVEIHRCYRSCSQQKWYQTLPSPHPNVAPRVRLLSGGATIAHWPDGGHLGVSKHFL